MASLSVDSSVLVKRHIAETGSAWFRTLADPSTGNTIITAQISIVEVISAFNRRMREATLNSTGYAQTRADFDALCAREYQLVMTFSGGTIDFPKTQVRIGKHIAEIQPLDTACSLSFAMSTQSTTVKIFNASYCNLLLL